MINLFNLLNILSSSATTSKYFYSTKADKPKNNKLPNEIQMVKELDLTNFKFDIVSKVWFQYNEQTGA